jgi:sterol desaturase/sphingolipid hydroxylase (fatty acid hydroxylase superfamily)
VIKPLLIAFLLLQLILTAGDLVALSQDRGYRSIGQAISRNRRGIVLVAIVWVLYFAIQNLGMALIPGLGSLPKFVGTAKGAPNALELLTAVLLLVWSFWVVGFWDYVSHRWVLHHRWFWILHENHHLPTVVCNGMPGISVRPYAAPTTVLTYAPTIPFVVLPLMWLGNPHVTETYVACLPVLFVWLTLILSLDHSLWARRSPRLYRFLRALEVTSPHEHLLHHSSARHCNYGNFCTLWDRIFGTYVDPMAVPLGQEPLGLDYDQDFLGTLCFGWLKVPQALRDYFGMNAVCRQAPAEAPGPALER